MAFRCRIPSLRGTGPLNKKGWRCLGKQGLYYEQNGVLSTFLAENGVCEWGMCIPCSARTNRGAPWRGLARECRHGSSVLCAGTHACVDQRERARDSGGMTFLSRLLYKKIFGTSAVSSTNQLFVPERHIILRSPAQPHDTSYTTQPTCQVPDADWRLFRAGVAERWRFDVVSISPRYRTVAQ